MPDPTLNFMKIQETNKRLQFWTNVYEELTADFPPFNCEKILSNSKFPKEDAGVDRHWESSPLWQWRIQIKECCFCLRVLYGEWQLLLYLSCPSFSLCILVKTLFSPYWVFTFAVFHSEPSWFPAPTYQRLTATWNSCSLGTWSLRPTGAPDSWAHSPNRHTSWFKVGKKKLTKNQ